MTKLELSPALDLWEDTLISGKGVMEALLLVDHGSRSHDANAQLSTIAELVRGCLPASVIVSVAHMEIAEPSIGNAIRQLVEAGAQHVVVVPYLLAPGRHASTDIPRIADEAGVRYRVRVSVAECLGVDVALADLVVRRAVAGGLRP